MYFLLYVVDASSHKVSYFCIHTSKIIERIARKPTYEYSGVITTKVTAIPLPRDLSTELSALSFVSFHSSSFHRRTASAQTWEARLLPLP